MNKTIKSAVRELLFRMISKYEKKKLVKQSVFQEKQDCLRAVNDFLGQYGQIVLMFFDFK